MDSVLSQRMTPILKCVVLSLFIFTAKVLTSRPHEVHEIKNSITHVKSSHYVRTFTKYHHRRTNQWNNNIDNDWHVTSDYVKSIEKRSVDPNSNEFAANQEILNLNQYAPQTGSENDVITDNKKSIGKEVANKNVISNESKKMKPIEPVSDLMCLYKTHSVAISVTPSYDEDKDEQSMVENENSNTPVILSEAVLNGETVQVQRCTDPRSSCYTLWHQDSYGNITVLGQGCWQAPPKRVCGVCLRVAPLPGTKFCCCTKHYCNADFLSLRVEAVTPRAEQKKDPPRGAGVADYTSAIACGALAAAALAVLAAACARARTRDPPPEKGDVMGTGPEALATGLLCVDNLTLIEHIGAGKFGSVWRGQLGSTPVAVKLYSHAGAWHKECAVYTLPGLAHPNLLDYYGSDSRAGAGGSWRSQLIVLELCAGTLRSRLEQRPLTWVEFATLAHGLASALAHLHTASGSKPCVVHRDVNSNNVLVAADGGARLADLGLAQALPPPHPAPHAAPSRIAEAGTLRYLSPEALEGALDLSGARAALCAVDVFALALVLWEMLWRCTGAHAGPAPPYAPPYAHYAHPTLLQMQTLVSRNKARPPLPRGPVAEPRALRLAADTCDECWDHDAEARLTAVCVEERMAELRSMLQPQRPLIHDNNLHHHDDNPTPPEADKNSNCTATQNCDVTTPLLYPHPHIGRNTCIERNTHTHNPHTIQLIHKSLKDITTPSDSPRQQNLEENCLSVARVTRPPVTEYDNIDRLNEIRSYQRPLEYVQNDVTVHEEGSRAPKQTNLLHDVKIEKPKWGLRKFFEKKLLNTKQQDIEVKLVPKNGQAGQNGRAVTTTVVNEKQGNNFDRPTNLVITQEGSSYNYEAPCTLSPPNKTLSPTMLLESEIRSENNIFGFKELPRDDDGRNQIFAVIVPKAKPAEFIDMRKRGSSESLNKSVRTSMSAQSIFKSGHSESEDSTVKKRLSCDNRIMNGTNSGRSSRASINLELQYIDNSEPQHYTNDSPFDLNSDCSSSEDEHLMLLSEGSKITMQTITKEKDKYQNEVLKDTTQTKTDFTFNKFQNKYTNFENEYSDPNDKENLVNGYSGDNPVYLAAINGEIDTTDMKILNENAAEAPRSPKPSLKSLTIKRQHSLEQVSEIFSSSSDVHLQNPAGRVKTPGDLPAAVRRARRDRALQKGRANETNRLSLYDDRMMFGNSL